MNFAAPHAKKSVWVALFAIIGIAIFFSAPYTSHAAFGISPPFLNADHLVPGITYTQTVYLVQDQPNQDLPIKAVLDIPAPAKDWITLDKGFDFVIPQGARQFPVVITVHVPDGQGLGKFTGNLSFTGQPSSAGQVTIALGVNVSINLTVGTGVFEQYSVPLIKILDIEEGWNPKVDVKFENDGNVPEGFDSATFDLYDQYDSVRLAYITKNDGFPVTPAFTTEEYTMEFPTDFHLGIGQYWGIVTFYKDQKVVATQKVIFNVLKAGSISGTWGIVSNFFKEYAVYIYFTLAVIIVLIGGLIMRSRKRRAGRN
jgi:hypothetical protein